MFDTEPADRPPLFQHAAAVADGDWCLIGGGILLDSTLDVASGPLEPARVAVEFEHVLARLAVLEPEHTPVSLDVHHTGARLDFLVSEATDASLRHRITFHRVFGLRGRCPSASECHRSLLARLRFE